MPHKHLRLGSGRRRNRRPGIVAFAPVLPGLVGPKSLLLRMNTYAVPISSVAVLDGVCALTPSRIAATPIPPAVQAEINPL